ncbi:hypothetical protein E4U17_003866 [Claviceps sp. LM77 group G4]|nr:hypothetical protein E4U17_003866 [Claviceps sp. LM77 group G4]KAG6072170.1 hypothetical protein E4U33_003327 [Claviceps sp. LM78 group G4]KAG6078079.1 hypothetical protein E4U16_001852 [Claviceps sp. LM84 group G4]
MTAPLPQQPVSAVPTAVEARKRRRRTTGGGAADDCFACVKRGGVKCDRRRPYCSQCLEIGNECSGYKTQLTWGVGVASRGKLRGLSLPIAQAPPVSRVFEKTAPSSCHRARSAVTGAAANWIKHQGPISRQGYHQPLLPNIHRLPLPPLPPPRQHQNQNQNQNQQQQQQQQQQQYGNVEVLSSLARSAPTTQVNSFVSATGHYDYFAAQTPPSHDATSPSPQVLQHGWNSIYASGLLQSNDAAPKYPRLPLPLITDLSSSVDSVSEVDYLSPLDHPYSRDDMHFGSGSPIFFDGYAASQQSSVAHTSSTGLDVLQDYHHQGRVPNSYPTLVYAASEQGAGLDSHHHLDTFDSHPKHKPMRECDGMAQPLAPCPVFPFP